jgi:hypothetical protein
LNKGISIAVPNLISVPFNAAEFGIAALCAEKEPIPAIGGLAVALFDAKDV